MTKLCSAFQKLHHGRKTEKSVIEMWHSSVERACTYFAADSTSKLSKVMQIPPVDDVALFRELPTSPHLDYSNRQKVKTQFT